jgi:hypothetical protein
VSTRALSKDGKKNREKAPHDPMDEVGPRLFFNLGVVTVRASRMMIGKPETNDIANRRKNEKNELRSFNQKHVFRMLREKIKTPKSSLTYKFR